MIKATAEVTTKMRILTDSELGLVSGGEGTSETVSGAGSGTVSGPAAGSGSIQHSHWDCNNKLAK